MFVWSTDGGSTFSAPRRINDDPVNHANACFHKSVVAAVSGAIM
jgi:hypothetical protein